MTRKKINVGKAIQEAITLDYLTEDARNYTGISEISYCIRKNFLKRTREEKTALNTATLIRFLVGRATHDYIQSLLWKLRGQLEGFSYRKSEKEIEIKTNDHTLRGHADLIARLGDQEFVIDFKIVGNSRFCYINEPDEHYVDQLILYAYGLGLNDCEIVYVNRETGETKYFDFTVDKNRVDYLLEKFERLENAIENNEEPDKAFETDSDSWECSYCQFYSHCWGEKTYPDKDGTALEKIPADLESEYVRVSQEFDLLKGDLDELKVALEQIGNGRNLVGDKLNGSYIPPSTSESYDKKLLEKEIDKSLLGKCIRTTSKKGYYRFTLKK